LQNNLELSGSHAAEATLPSKTRSGPSGSRPLSISITCGAACSLPLLEIQKANSDRRVTD